MRKYSHYIFLCGLWLLLVGALQFRPVRWDMTDDKHYSLSDASKALLRSTEEPIEVTILLEGEMSSGFRRLQKAVKETLEEMAVYTKSLRVETIDMNEADEATLKRYAEMGVMPYDQTRTEHNGKAVIMRTFPYVVMKYGGKTSPVAIFNQSLGMSEEDNLNASIEQLEFMLMEALHRLRQKETGKVVILEGHGEPDEAHTYDLMTALSRYYQVDRGSLAENQNNGIDVHILDGYKAVIIANPQTAFSDAERFVIDQYIMRGGKVLWVVNGVQFSNGVLQTDGFTPVIPLELGLTEMLYRYGVRVNPALVQDIQCLPIPVNMSGDPQKPNLQPVPWTYAPLLLTSQGSPITRNVGQVMSTFVSPIDAVGGEDGIEKRVLLATSTATRVTATPGEVNLNDMNPKMEEFQYQYVPVAVSMEGAFGSAYAHRMMPEGVKSDEPVRKQGVKTRQVVVGSGSVIMNEIQRGQVLPMGYDRLTRMQFSNRDFIVNAILWMTDSEGLISLREKTVALRLLNDKRAHDERTKIQLVSTVCPIAILALIGTVVVFIRRRKYT